jgi:hypothetical protein
MDRFLCSNAQETYGSIRGFIFSVNKGCAFSTPALNALNAAPAAPLTIPCMMLIIVLSAVSLPASGSPSMTSFNVLSYIAAHMN